MSGIIKNVLFIYEFPRTEKYINRFVLQRILICCSKHTIFLNALLPQIHFHGGNDFRSIRISFIAAVRNLLYDFFYPLFFRCCWLCFSIFSFRSMFAHGKSIWLYLLHSTVMMLHCEYFSAKITFKFQEIKAKKHWERKKINYFINNAVVKRSIYWH